VRVGKDNENNFTFLFFLLLHRGFLLYLCSVKSFFQNNTSQNNHKKSNKMANFKIIKDLLDAKGLSQKQLADEIGMAESSIYGLITRGKANVDNIEKIATALNVSPAVFFMDENTSPDMLTSMSKKTIKYYDIDVMGGTNSLFNDSISKPSYCMIIPGFEHCPYSVSITGDSMETDILSGDRLLLQPIDIKQVKYGAAYLMVIDGMRTVKYVRKTDIEDIWLLVPANTKKYDEFKIKRNKISEIYWVAGYIHQNSF